MWIIPKSSPFFRFAADTEVSNSDYPPHWRILCESLQWRSKPTHWRTWSQRLKRVSWLSRLCGRTCEPSRRNDFEDALISSLRATHASRSVLPVSGKEPTIPDTFGRLLLESSRQLSLFGASLRTSPDTSAWDSPTFTKAYETWVTQLREACLQRQSAERPTSGNGSLSYPTIQAHDAQGPKTPEQIAAMRQKSKAGVRNLNEAVNWPTVSLCGQHNRKGASQNSGDGLSTAVKQWPTPQHSEYKGQSQRGQFSPDDRLSNKVAQTDGQPVPASLSMNGKSPESLWSTPRSIETQQYNSKDNGQALSRQVLWATPAADYPGDDVNKLSLSPKGKATRIDNKRMVQTSLTVQLGVQRNKLNPSWVEQLMGLPVGWTKVNVETLNDSKIRRSQGAGTSKAILSGPIGREENTKNTKDNQTASETDIEASRFPRRRESRQHSRAKHIRLRYGLRTDRLRLLGNGVLPQQAEKAFRDLIERVTL